MSGGGVFAVDRGIWDHPMFASREPFSRREAWLWLLSAAVWKSRTVFVDRKRVELARGQLAFSVRFLAEQWRWKKSTVHRFLNELKDEAMIETKAGRSITIITICNYNKYQRVSQPDRDAVWDSRRDDCGTTAGHPRDKEEDMKNNITLSPVSEAVQKKAVRSAIGTLLSSDWIPDEATSGRVKADFGMTDADLQAELPAFHAHNVANASFSADWGKTFWLWCKRWKEHRDKQPAPRVQLSRSATSTTSQRQPEDLTEAVWDREVSFYARTGRWSRGLGPDPMHVGRCKAPRHILDRHGINPETGERQILPRKVPA